MGLSISKILYISQSKNHALHSLYHKSCIDGHRLFSRNRLYHWVISIIHILTSPFLAEKNNYPSKSRKIFQATFTLGRNASRPITVSDASENSSPGSPQMNANENREIPTPANDHRQQQTQTPPIITDRSRSSSAPPPPPHTTLPQSTDTTGRLENAGRASPRAHHGAQPRPSKTD